MLEYVSKHPAVAAERDRASLGVVCVVGRLVSTDVNVTGQAGTDTIYRENPILVFSKTAFFDMGCVYIDTCSTILLGKLNTYN